MIGLAQHLSDEFKTVFVCFSEEGLCGDFMTRARALWFEAHELRHDTPQLVRAAEELVGTLRCVAPRLLVTHHYKADLLGLLAAHRLNLPVVSWSHGWTHENFKVRLYEMLDRRCLRYMDRVVCVSRGQAVKVERAGVSAARIVVIRDAIRAERFASIDPAYEAKLREFFPGQPGKIVAAAGRLSREKGFADLVDAATIVIKRDPSVRFILFGEGRLRGELEQRIARCGLKGSFILAGFRRDLDSFLPFLDLIVLPSYTEGLPNVVLEAFSAGVPVVATAVGGTPELVEDGINGRLVPPRNPPRLAEAIGEMLADGESCRAMGRRGRRLVLEEFSFARQVAACRPLFADLIDRGARDRRAASDRGIPVVGAGS
jgi:glycosyltransferase involved in cell wall biosynthesis